MITERDLDIYEAAYELLYTDFHTFTEELQNRFLLTQDEVVSFWDVIQGFADGYNRDVSLRYALYHWLLEQHGEQQEMPSIFQLAKNFSSSMMDFAKSGFEMATDEEVERRLLVCKFCEHYSGIGRCFKCGCYMPVKVHFAAMQCPVGKW
jgi:hypothetical protein